MEAARKRKQRREEMRQQKMRKKSESERRENLEKWITRTSCDAEAGGSREREMW